MTVKIKVGAFVEVQAGLLDPDMHKFDMGG